MHGMENIKKIRDVCVCVCVCVKDYSYKFYLNIYYTHTCSTSHYFDNWRVRWLHVSASNSNKPLQIHSRHFTSNKTLNIMYEHTNF